MTTIGHAQVPGPRTGSDVLLRDGGIALVRAVDTGDGPALYDLNDRSSEQTRFLRFCTASEAPGRSHVEKVMQSRRDDNALVAVVDGRIVGLASFFRLERDPAVADLALLVDDAYQGRGLGALLLEQLAQAARPYGVTAFTADVLLENGGMRDLLTESGFATSVRASRGVAEFYVDLTDRPELRTALDARNRVAERASLRPVLAPTRVAVVGSARPRSVAERIYRAILDGGYGGDVVRLDRHDSLLDGDPVDLVVVAVAAAHVLGVARDAAAAGAKGLLVIGAGFAEVGTAGSALQQELLAVCRGAGMRLVGPNCLGIVNTDPAIRLNATFCDAAPLPGRVALVSQSGAIGVAALRHAERRGTGLSLYVSTGNKADVSGNDLLAYLDGDPRTSVIALYLESFGNARRFARVAASVGRRTPIVVVKAGTTAAGARAGRSHTAAAATPAVAVDALLHAAGVIRVDDLPGMFDVLSLLQGAPLPTGPRLAVIGNSGGPGVLAADACAGAGLRLAGLSETTTGALRALLPPGAAVDNPVDLLATVRPQDYERAVGLVLRDPGVDAVLAIYTPLTAGSEEPVAAALARAQAAAPSIPVIAAFPGVREAPAPLQPDAATAAVPFFEFPEPAVRAVGRVVAYTAWRDAPPDLSSTRVAAGPGRTARAVLGHVPETGTRWLSPQEVTQVLEGYRIPLAAHVEALDPDGAVAAAESLGYPVALKAAGVTVLHKTDSGGVALDLARADEVRAAFHAMADRVGPAMTSVLVQRMHPADGGLELIAGLTVDASVGPLVLVGSGGTLTELLDDRTVRLPPVSRAAALHQLGSLRCSPRLAGYRGSPPLDAGAAAEVLLRLGDIARDLPEILELDINPLLVTPTGVLALDARIRVGAPGRATDPSTRALSRTLPARPSPE